MRLPSVLPFVRVKFGQLCRKQKISLTYVLAGSFVGQLLVVVGVVSGLSYYNSQKAINKLAQQLESEVVNHVSAKLDGYLDSPRQINELNVGAIHQGLLQLSDLKTVEKVFWQQMQVFPVGYISFANPQGDFIGVERLESGQILLNELLGSRGAELMTVYATDQQGERNKLIEHKAYRPYLEAWYIDAVKAGKPLWSNIYQWDDKPDIFSISHSYPLYNSQNELLGVMSVDYLLTQVSEYLRGLSASHQHKIFIVEPNGAMVASSTAELPYLVEQGQARRLNAVQSKDPTIRAAIQYLTRRFGSLSAAAINGQYNSQFEWQGNQQYVQTRQWQDRYGLNWIIIVVAPESELMAQLNSNKQATGLVCIVATLLAIACGVMTARWVTKPILQTSSASVSLAAKLEEEWLAIDLDSGELATDRGTTEVQALATSFNQMARRLKQSFSTLATVNDHLVKEVEQKTAALEQAEAATEVARQATRLKDEFLANMSHELRTPLNAILGISESLIEEIFGSMNPQQIWAVELVEKSGTHLLELINDILDLAKIEAGQLELQLAPMEIDRVCQASLAFVQQQAQNKQIQLDIQLPESLPSAIWDERRIRQVLINLLNNAVKFTLTGGSVCLSVSMKPGQRNWPDTVQIVVMDTGIGIAPENISKLFQTFSQIDSALNRQYDGSGLGLSLVKKIVEGHGGQVDVTSELGIGSCFTIELPCVPNVILTPVASC